MTQRKESYEELPSPSPSTSFTITQYALGSPLEFEPAVGSKELDNLINNYISGPAAPQQKRAQVVVEFLNSIDGLPYNHPVSIRYHVPQILTPQTMPRHLSMSSIDYGTTNKETLNAPKSSPSLKRSRQESTPPNGSSAKRLPGFSIMTTDGIDITDLASRGPKTKEQRDHAALMRKLKACAVCKKSKQRCDPSHHRPAPSSLSTSSSAAPSNRSAKLSRVSPAEASRASISPQSLFGEAFTQSPPQGFADHTTAQMGRSFQPLPTPRPSLSPPESMLSETIFSDSDLLAFPTPNLDHEDFQWADMELDSWNNDFTAFPPADYNSVWDSQEDIFAPSYGYEAPIASQDVRSGEQGSSRSSAQVIPHANDGQNHDRKPYPFGEPTQGTVHSVGLDNDQFLLPSLSREEARVISTGHSTTLHMDMLRGHQSQQGMLDSVYTPDRDYVLYPDSPQFDWGLEPHQISRDISDKYGGVESGKLKKHRIEPPAEKKDLTKYRAQTVCDDTLSVPQSAELRSYLPSPSASDGSEDNKSTCGLDCYVSGARDSVNYLQDVFLQNSNYAQSLSEDLSRGLMGAVQRPHDVPATSGNLVHGHHNLHPGVTATSSSSYPFDQGYSAQFEPPQGLVLEDAQNPTTNVVGDQQVQHVPRKWTLSSSVNSDDWDRAWKDRDLRRTGLLTGVLGAGNDAVQMCFSNHDATRVDTIAYNAPVTFVAETELLSARSSLSSDIPGEDGIRNHSRERPTRQCLGLDQSNSQPKDTSLQERLQSDNAQREPSLPADTHDPRGKPGIVQNPTPVWSQSMVWSDRMIVILTLCTFMAISILSTISLLMASNLPIGNPKPGASPGQYLFFTCNTDNYSSVASHVDGSSIPSEHDSGPGFIQAISGFDILPFTVEHNYEESNQGWGSRADIFETEMTLNKDEMVYESFSSHSTGYPSPTQDLASQSMAPVATITPSPTNSAIAWTTHLPTRLTANSVNAHHTAITTIKQNPSFRLPSSSRLLQFLKRPWSWRFNPGHLGMRITSLTIL